MNDYLKTLVVTILCTFCALSVFCAFADFLGFKSSKQLEKDFVTKVELQKVVNAQTGTQQELTKIVESISVLAESQITNMKTKSMDDSLNEREDRSLRNLVYENRDRITLLEWRIKVLDKGNTTYTLSQINNTTGAAKLYWRK